MHKQHTTASRLHHIERVDGGGNFLSVDLSTTVDLTNKALEMRLLKQLTFFLSLWFMFFINFLI